MKKAIMISSFEQFTTEDFDNISLDNNSYNNKRSERSYYHRECLSTMWDMIKI
jgi:hypothetical protein